ncbi:MAG TPA: hypothetical protein VNX18_03425 [Bryobacteraceae bacterium]|nr:hypothetical protein [Bryobacteraceae bacterium]
MRKTLLVVAGVLLVACSRDIQNSQAVRSGVLDYLTANQSKIGLNPDAMQIDVTSVSFQENEARATVVFRAKGAADSTPMPMVYNLARDGNKWVVRGKAESGGSPHGGEAPQGQLPAGHPPVGSKQ